MPSPHVPVTSQLTQLAALQATAAAALTAYNSALANVLTTKTALVAAQKAVTDYQAYIAGGRKQTVIDEGNQNTV